MTIVITTLFLFSLEKQIGKFSYWSRSPFHHIVMARTANGPDFGRAANDIFSGWTSPSRYETHVEKTFNFFELIAWAQFCCKMWGDSLV